MLNVSGLGVGESSVAEGLLPLPWCQFTSRLLLKTSARCSGAFPSCWCLTCRCAEWLEAQIVNFLGHECILNVRHVLLSFKIP